MPCASEGGIAVVQFNRIQDGQLYLSDTASASGSTWAYALLAYDGSYATQPSDKSDLPNGPVSLSGAVAMAPDMLLKGWATCLVYFAVDTGAIAGDAEGWIATLQDMMVNTSAMATGMILFVTSGDVASFDAADSTYIGLEPDGGVLSSGRSSQIDLIPLAQQTGFALRTSSCILTVPNTPEKPDGDVILFSPDQGAGYNALVDSGTYQTTIHISGADASLQFSGVGLGAMTAQARISANDLRQDLGLGFQMIVPNPMYGHKVKGETPVKNLTAYLPLADLAGSRNTFLYTLHANFGNPNNKIEAAAETAFFFTGANTSNSPDSKTTLPSYYRTAYGKDIRLIPVAGGTEPARLVVNLGYMQTPLQPGFCFSPEGDFTIEVDGARPGVPVKILCGLSGTETVSVLPQIDGSQDGFAMRFFRDRPANAPNFPLQAASPVGPPIDAKAKLLDGTYQTSWVTFVPAPTRMDTAAVYSAAPKGAELFGKYEDTQTRPAGIFGPTDPGLVLPADGSKSFPMLPLAGFKGSDGIQDITSEEFETLTRQIIGPSRKTAIDAGETKKAASPIATLAPQSGMAMASAAEDIKATTTPAGFITNFDRQSGDWAQLMLAQVQDKDNVIQAQMGFTQLDDTLQAAFQTTDQFLVIANAAHLGALKGQGVFMPPSTADIRSPAQFYNGIPIGQWDFAVETGTDNEYGDYRNIIIVKGVHGAILALDDKHNPTDASLAMSPDKWTKRDIFATTVPGDTGQLTPLSGWLVEYCHEAWLKRESPYFAKFAQIVTDPNWTGVLILKAEIAKLPSDLAGILAGVKDPKDFYAHHIGIEIGQIDRDKVQQKETSSTFGLVYYIDPLYDDAEEPHTIAPRDPDADESFTLLKLSALFENSAIKKFESLAQMVLNKLYGSDVEAMIDIKPGGDQPNPNNAVLLEGGLQRNGDAVVYSLGSKWPNLFLLKNNILNSVEIDAAQMSTRDDGSKSGKIVSWIGMSGFMNFAVIPAMTDPNTGDELPAFDIFSFGAKPGDETALRQGLAFSNLGLRVTTDVDVVNEADPPDPILELIEGEIAFNLASSTPREGSLYTGFHLELVEMMSGDNSTEAGDDKTDPASVGYLPAITQYQLRGVGSGKWHGLKLKVYLGSPGALAGKVNLDSTMMLAWSDNSGEGSGGSTFNAFVGIELPGAGSGGSLFSLQTVLKLSIGLIQLLFKEPGADPKTDPGGFMLVLNQIALKFLGLLKVPPSGNTAFLLFGNPDVTKAADLGWFAVYNKAKAKAAKDKEGVS
ncbi:hypothetical protein SAMN04487859_104139 [Roseovarius lutimaris]|uniref:Uncharacterized protein n=1 Tax=Roseovarius lutimaris TaxID=1005928 RepID=A0A1I4ZV66_9RHOB|nr:hypothetical protein SAMN04487859_104139 [Roseovarius lutimaris]